MKTIIMLCCIASSACAYGAIPNDPGLAAPIPSTPTWHFEDAQVGCDWKCDAGSVGDVAQETTTSNDAANTPDTSNATPSVCVVNLPNMPQQNIVCDAATSWTWIDPTNPSIQQSCNSVPRCFPGDPCFVFTAVEGSIPGVCQ